MDLSRPDADFEPALGVGAIPRENSWARLRVKNVGRSLAENVEVVIEDISTYPARGQEHPLELSACHGRLLKWADRPDARVAIPPLTTIKFDLFHVVKTAELTKRKLLDPIQITLADRGWQGHRGNLPRRAYKIDLAIAGSNLRVTRHSFVIEAVSTREFYDLRVQTVRPTRQGLFT